jgi:hypothetical protein
MKARSAHNKGNRFENYLVNRLRETIDATTHRTYGSGSGLDKNDIRIPKLNIEIEAKNQGVFHLGEDWEQAKRQKTTGNTAILAIRHPRQPEFKETLIVMDLEDWISLIQSSNKDSAVSFTANKDDKWKLQKLIESAKQVIKIYEQGIL